MMLKKSLFSLHSLVVVLLLLDAGHRQATVVAAAQQQEQQPDNNDNDASISSSSSFRIAGYLPDYRFDGMESHLNRTVQYLDDLYLFSLSPQTQLGENMFALCCLKSKHYELARQARASSDEYGLNLWVTVGGGGRSHNFVKNPSDMIKSIRNLIKNENLQGVDFDCEEFTSHEDYIEYERLIASASYVLQKDGIQISIALHAGQLLENKQIYKMVDRINLMTYDMNSASSSYHADWKLARSAITKLIDAGCPKEKIFLGIPMYGRHKQDISQTKTYAELVDGLDKNIASNRDKLYNQYEMDGYLVDSQAAVAAKIRYAMRLGLGGAFFWELGQDKIYEGGGGGGVGMLLLAAAQSREHELELQQAEEEDDEEEGEEESGKDEL